MTTEHVTQPAPTQEPTTQAVSTPQNNFTIPEAYANAGWVEKIKSPEDLWKTTANLQELIGKRPAGIPANDASDAEWDNFYKAAGRPDKPEYQFSDPEGLPEAFDTAEYKQTASEILHAAGLNQKQADKVYKLYLQKELESASKRNEQEAERQKQLDAEFDTLTKEYFGDQYESTIQVMNEAVTRFTPQSLKESYSVLANHPKALAAVAATIKGMQDEIGRVKKEYGAEGSITSGSQTAGQNIDDVRNELSTLRTSMAARDFTHSDYKTTQARIAELSGVVSRHYKN